VRTSYLTGRASKTTCWRRKEMATDIAIDTLNLGRIGIGAQMVG